MWQAGSGKGDSGWRLVPGGLSPRVREELAGWAGTLWPSLDSSVAAWAFTLFPFQDFSVVIPAKF